MNEVILKTRGLTKRYKDHTALDHADMTVYREDIYGLIGRNGAGKTTMMKIVTGITEPTEGEYELFGQNSGGSSAGKKRIGSLIEEPAFYGYMTAYQNLKYYCLQKGITDHSQIDKALELVKLTDVKDKKVKKFSLGMKQRLGIALAVLDEPDMVILDEPINGLDPIGISELRDTFRTLAHDKGITLIISSHILSELYEVANRFLFIDKGRILKEVSKSELDLECSRCLVVKTDNTKAAAVAFENKLGISSYKVIDSQEIRVYDTGTSIPEISKAMIESGAAILGIYESGVSLEDYFIQLIGEAE